MPTKNQIDLEVLGRMLAAGKSGRECAAYFSVTPGAITQAKARLKRGAVNSRFSGIDSKIALLPHDPGRRVDTVDRIAQIEQGLDSDMEKLLELFEQAVSINEKGSIIKLRGDILGNHRKLLLTKLEYLRGVADLQVIPQLVSEILDAIEEVDHGSRDKILRRLEQVLGPAAAIVTGAPGAVSPALQGEGESTSFGGRFSGDDGGGGLEDVSGESSRGDGE